MQAVHLLEDNYDIGDILNIKVFDADKNSLKGEVIQWFGDANWKNYIKE